MEDARLSESNGNAKPVLTGDIYDRQGFADASGSGSIDLGLLTNEDQERIYQMADQTVPQSTDSKSLSQTYYEEVEALKADGISNAEAIRQVAEKHDKKENAVRGGLYQYKKAHANGSTPTTTTRRARRPAARGYDDYLAEARTALEAARDLIDREVNEAKAALDAAQKHYDEVVASVADRKADIAKKLKALS